jgi:hypothetical protein
MQPGFEASARRFKDDRIKYCPRADRACSDSEFYHESVTKNLRCSFRGETGASAQRDRRNEFRRTQVGKKLRLGFQSDVGDAADEVVGGGFVFFDAEDFEGGGRIVGAED